MEREIFGYLYKVTYVGRNAVFVECTTTEDLFRFVAKEVIAGSYITSIVQIKPNGMTPKVRVLSDPQFKKELRKMEKYVKEGECP